METPTTLICLGIVICVSQSAIFSGLNLALFSVSRLRLENESVQIIKIAADHIV
jgi:CBS domain containing-hemolysin-like protein